MFIDIDCMQQKKYTENTYGDYFISKRYKDSKRLVAVLSDGLGSGIKANILSCMTATMLLKFIEAKSDIIKACEITLNALPVCKIRKISYSTFSAIDCDDEGNVKIVEEGNPEFILIRDNQVIPCECSMVTSETFPNRQMHIYRLKLQKNDRLIFCSDGVTQAALGTKKYKLGLRREGVINIILDKLRHEPNISSRNLARYLVDNAVMIEPNQEPMDDISVVSLYFREPRNSIVFTGPPYYADKDNFYANEFLKFNGKKAICGGTTANLISRELNIPINCVLDPNLTGGLPTLSKMDGIDLVTEGVLTLSRTYEYLENDITASDPAGELMQFFLNSDCLTFMVGAKVNQAHYDPKLPVEIEIRKNIIRKITRILEEKFIKKVILQYI